MRRSGQRRGGIVQRPAAVEDEGLDASIGQRPGFFNATAGSSDSPPIARKAVRESKGRIAQAETKEASWRRCHRISR